MRSIRSNVCVTVSEGAPLRCYMTASDEACVEIGEVDHELTFDFVTFRELVAQANAVLGEMEAKASEGEAEWEAAQKAAEATDSAS